LGDPAAAKHPPGEVRAKKTKTSKGRKKKKKRREPKRGRRPGKQNCGGKNTFSKHTSEKRGVVWHPKQSRPMPGTTRNESWKSAFPLPMSRLHAHSVSRAERQHGVVVGGTNKLVTDIRKEPLMGTKVIE